MSKCYIHAFSMQTVQTCIHTLQARPLVSVFSLNANQFRNRSFQLSKSWHHDVWLHTHMQTYCFTEHIYIYAFSWCFYKI